MKVMKLALLLLLCGWFTNMATAGEITLENVHYRYLIKENGINLAFIDKVSGKDYLLRSGVSCCASIVLQGKEHPVRRGNSNEHLKF